MDGIVAVITIALAAAVSSVPLMVTILLLLSSNRSRSALPFLIGWVVGLFAVVVVFTVVAQAVPASRSPRRPDTVVGVLEILIGSVIFGVAAISWWRSRRASKTPSPSRLTSVTTLGPWSSLGLGLVLNLRPKGLLLAVAAALSIRTDAQSTSAAFAMIGIYTAVAASTVAVPIIATLVAPHRLEPVLARVQGWMTRHGDMLTSVILGLIGLVIVGMGIARL